MSAYLVSKKHIDLLVTAAASDSLRGCMFQEERDALGRLLWRENMRSIEARYGTSIDAESLSGYRHERGALPEPVVVIKAIQCYEYQSCEHDMWEKSEAYQQCRQLLSAQIARLPGYDAAPWGV